MATRGHVCCLAERQGGKGKGAQSWLGREQQKMWPETRCLGCCLYVTTASLATLWPQFLILPQRTEPPQASGCRRSYSLLCLFG